MSERSNRELVSRAYSGARTIRRTGRLVEGIAIAALAGQTVSWLVGALSWGQFLPAVVITLVSGLLVGRLAWSRSIALELSAAQFEHTLASRPPGAPAPSGGEGAARE